MRQVSFGSRLRVLVLPLLAVVAIGALATAASAASTMTPWAGMKTNVSVACSDQAIVTPFTSWGDTGQYTFAPNGGFESGLSAWTINGWASAVSGNEPFYVHSKADQKLLSLSSGSAVTTPAICSGINYPWARIFASGPSGSTLTADLLSIDSAGTARTVRIATLTGTGGWALSSRLEYASLQAFATSKLAWTDASGARFTAVAIRFTASGGTWKLDDLYVDPFKLR